MSSTSLSRVALASGSSRLALVALFSGATVISLAPILVRLSELGPVATAFWRMILALPALWLWLSLETGPATARRQIRRHGYGWLLAAGLCLTGDLALWHWSIRITSVANATLLVNCAPVFVTLGAWLFFRERVTLSFLVGLGLALVGVTLLVSSSMSLSLTRLAGDALGLTAAVFYAGYILSVKQLRAYFATGTIMAIAGTVTGLTLLPVALLMGETLLAVSLSGWLVLLGLALLVQSGGQGLIAYALAQLPAPFSAVGLLLQPVLATFFAWLIFEERLTVGQGLGGVVVLAGIFLARQASRPSRRPGGLGGVPPNQPT